jgi:hypothetical protein
MKLVTIYISIFLVVTLPTALPARASGDVKCLSKLNTLRNDLTDYQKNSRRWATAWGITWTTATVSQLTIAVAIQDHQTREDLWVGSASAALGVIPAWIIPPESTRDFELTGNCEEQLTQAESLARRIAADSEIYTGTTAQIGNLAGNLMTSLILGLAFGHWGAAAISFAAGVPLGEVMILTYPKPGEELHKEVGVAIVPSPAGPALALSLGF